MTKKQILEEYLSTHNIPESIAQKVNINSFLTENFAYMAFRMGNSIGDILDISIEIILLEEIAKKYNLVVNTTEHAELHARGISEKDLDSLLKGAVTFENIKHNKKIYKHTLKDISDFIRKQMDDILKG